MQSTQASGRPIDHSGSGDEKIDTSINGDSSPMPDLQQDTNSRGTIDSEYKYITGLHLFAVMSSVTFVCFLMMLDTSIIVTAIPRITNDFHSLADVGWYGSSYLLASCSLQPMTGKLYTEFSSKYLFLTFFAVFELGSLLCGVANGSKMLIVGRAIAGMGTSGIMNGALTIISSCVPLERRPFLLGLMIGISQLAIVMAPLIGGALTQYVTWRWCFYINLPPGGIIASILYLIHIPDRTVKGKDKPTIRGTLAKLDLIGFALFAPAIVQLLLALEWGGSLYAWNSATIIGLFCGAAGTFLMFLAWQYHKKDEAMMPFPMIRQQVVWTSCMSMFFFFGAQLITTYYLPIYFQGVRNATPTLSGVYILPGIISQIIMAVLSGKLVTKLGYYLPWAVACGALQAIGCGLISTFTQTTSTGEWIGYQIIAGVGRGAGMQMAIIAVQNSLKPRQIPVAMAMLVFVQTFGGALFLSLAETTFSNALVKALASDAPGVDAHTVVVAGATAWRHVVPPGQAAGVLAAYVVAVQKTFYLAVGSAVGMFVVSWGMGWRRIGKKEGGEKTKGKADENVKV